MKKRRIRRDGKIVSEVLPCKQCHEKPVHEDCGDFCSDSCVEAWEDDAFAAHAKKKKPRPKILVNIQGGLIQGILSNRKDIDVIVVDFDSPYRKGDDPEDDRYLQENQQEDFEEAGDGDDVPDTANVWKYDIEVQKKNFFETFGGNDPDCEKMFIKEWLRRHNF